MDPSEILTHIAIPPSNCLYLQNLPAETTPAILSSIFGGMGNLTSVRVIKDQVTGEPKG